MICVFGSTGNVGLPLTKALSDKGVSVRAVVINEEEELKLKGLPCVETFIGDAYNMKSVEDALQGCDYMYLLLPASATLGEDVRKICEVAKKVGIKGIVKHSAYTAAYDEVCGLCRWHFNGDQALIQSGIPYTIIYPNTFMQTIPMVFSDTIAKDSRMASLVGRDKKISMVDARDIAEVTAEVLAREEYNGEHIMISGPEAITYEDCARIITRKTKKQVYYVQTTERDDLGRLIRLGYPDAIAESLVDLFRIYERNDCNQISDSVLKYTGHEARSFEQFVEDNLDYFNSLVANH